MRSAPALHHRTFVGYRSLRVSDMLTTTHEKSVLESSADASTFRDLQLLHSSLLLLRLSFPWLRHCTPVSERLFELCAFGLGNFPELAVLLHIDCRMSLLQVRLQVILPNSGCMKVNLTTNGTADRHI